MVDKQKVSVLADALKKPGQRVGKGMSFGKFAGSARLKETAEDWNISLKQQQWDAKVLECGREVVSDRPVKKNRHSRVENENVHDDEDDDIANDDSENAMEVLETGLGAYLEEFPSQQSCASWEEARDQVINELSLNDKQKTLINLISVRFSSTPEAAPIKQHKQLRIYLGGESGTGKSRVISGVKLLLEKMGKRRILQLAGASGAAADNIDGATIHSCLGLTVQGRKPGKGTIMRLRKQWAKKEILIIDEASMISLKELCEIDQCCREVKNDYDSTFGGISVVVLCGDFYQMPPVSGHALYWNLEGKREIDDMEEEDLRETDER